MTNPETTDRPMIGSTERYYGPGEANGRYLVLTYDEIVGEEEAYRTSDLAIADAEFERARQHHPYVTSVSIYDTVAAQQRKSWNRDPSLTPQSALTKCPF